MSEGGPAPADRVELGFRLVTARRPTEAELQAPMVDITEKIDDPVRMYLTQMGEIPLLTRQQEIALAKEIEITRSRFRRKLLECDWVIQSAVKVLRRVHQGSIWLDGKDITRCSTRERMYRGLTHIPEDRHRRGLILQYSLTENFLLGFEDSQPYVRGPFLNYQAAESHAAAAITKFDVRTPGLEVFAIHENARHPNPAELRDARTGQMLWGKPGAGVLGEGSRGPDVGRGNAMDIDPRYPGYEMWASGDVEGVYTAQLSTPDPELGPRGRALTSDLTGGQV